MNALRFLRNCNVSRAVVQPNNVTPAYFFHGTRVNCDNTPKKAYNDGKNRFGKSFKTIEFKDKIEEHDLKSKANHMKKWLLKGHTIRSIIHSQNQENNKSEQIYNILVKELGSDGKFECKKSAKDIRFTVDPLSPPGENVSNKESDQEKQVNNK